MQKRNKITKQQKKGKTLFPIQNRKKENRGKNRGTSPLLPESFEKRGSPITDNEYEIKSEMP